MASSERSESANHEVKTRANSVFRSVIIFCFFSFKCDENVCIPRLVDPMNHTVAVGPRLLVTLLPSVCHIVTLSHCILYQCHSLMSSNLSHVVIDSDL